MSSPRRQRARGKPGAGRTRSLACKMKKHTSKSTTGSPVHAGFPRAIGFNGLLRALPGVHDFLVTVIGAMQSIVANLTPAKGRLVPAFRSSCVIVEPLSRTSESKGHKQIHDSSAAFDLKFLIGTRGNLCRNFKSAALVTTRLRRPRRCRSSDGILASIASRAQRP